MKKTSAGTPSQRKQRGTAKTKRSAWSIEKATILRRPPSLPSAGDCSCAGK
jgi:hypothetical protein